MKKCFMLFRIIVMMVFTFSGALMAQPLPGGNNPGGSGPAGPPTGNPLSAPIGDSVLPLLLIGVAYALVKLYHIYKIKTHSENC